VDVVLHLHPAPEAPAPPLASLIPDARLSAPILVVYTKGDLVEDAARARLAGSACCVSAASGAGIPELLERVRPLLPTAPFQHDPDDVGTQPLRFFVAEYLREAAFEFLQDEVPYSVAAQVEEFREHAKPVYIRAFLYVERESQKSIVIGQGGSMLKRIGQHARSRLEALMGEQVYLECRVKVAPHWRKSSARLDDLGISAAEGGP
jgi:GTP-binding protein Era